MTIVHRLRNVAAGTVLLGAAVLPLVGAGAQSPPPPAGEATALGIDPEAIGALKAMAAYMSTLTSFEITTVSTTEATLDNNLKFDVNGWNTFKVRRPDRFLIELNNDLFHQIFRFDGSTLTMEAPETGYYAQVPAPPTIREVLTELASKYGLELPLADLFDNVDAQIAEIQSAIYIGTSWVNGQECDHWAFQTSEMDVQVWVRKSDKPLPLRIVTIDVMDPTLPRHDVVLTWNEAATFPADVFAFAPSEGSKRINLMTVAALKELVK